VSQQQWIDRYQGAVMNTFGPPRLVLERGEGVWVWDADGRRYLDLLAGIAVNALGHAHPALVKAVSEQVATLAHVSNFFTSVPQVRLAERLLQLLGAEGAGRVFLSNSGTEANEAALKLTRRTGRTGLVAATGAFHGRSMGALALTAKAAYREPFEPLPGDVTFVPYGDADALTAAVDDTTAAVVLEPVQGEAGAVVAPEGYLAAARAATARHGALLWLDEVQCGMGRTGDWFAHTSSGVSPDLVTLAKGLGGGIPIGATVALGAAATLLQPGNHGTTFGGNPVATSAALAVIDTIDAEGLLANATAVGGLLREGLADHPLVREVTGRGLLLGIGLRADVGPQACDAALAAGLIINCCAPDRLRLAPPLVLSSAEAGSAVVALRAVLDEVTP
jgi:acetylornithine/N-succinyldiaminopimelate aminotransferase